MWLECFPEKPSWYRNGQVCRGRSVKRFERSNGLDTALYTNVYSPFFSLTPELLLCCRRKRSSGCPCCLARSLHAASTRSCPTIQDRVLRCLTQGSLLLAGCSTGGVSSARHVVPHRTSHPSVRSLKQPKVQLDNVDVSGSWLNAMTHNL